MRLLIPASCNDSVSRVGGGVGLGDRLVALVFEAFDRGDSLVEVASGHRVIPAFGHDPTGLLPNLVSGDPANRMARQETLRQIQAAMFGRLLQPLLEKIHVLRQK